MIRIQNYLHRDAMSDLIRRWMYNQTYPSDAQLVTRLVHFNNVVVSRYLDLFCETLFAAMRGKPQLIRRTQIKKDLKDLIVENPPIRNKRIDELIITYHAKPERFYGETPFHATVYFAPSDSGNLYIGSSRIKRVRRLAEKCARRIIDHMFMAIKRSADALADDRARRLGIPRQYLITRPEDMREEFVRAEIRLLDDLRNLRPIQFDGEMQINDVAGIKIILEDFEIPRLLERCGNLPGCTILEQEQHRGQYNAVNLIVRYRPPKERILARPLAEPIVRRLGLRGIAPEQANHAFREFVNEGEQEVHIEIILSSYQEMLESEIGRCMHEDRIIEQRLRQEYHGYLAKNVEYLIQYLFNVAVSSLREQNDLPIKLWIRYLPDYIDEVLRSLYDLPPIAVLE